MKLIKVFGLTAIVAAVAMAFVGASSASAETTALCTIDVAKCPEANLVKHVHLEDPAALLKTVEPKLTITCVALYLGDVLSPWLANAPNPLVIHGNLTYSSCKPVGCEAKEVSASSLLNVLRLGIELADVTGSGQVLVKCGEILHCIYDGEGLVGHKLGPLVTGDNGHITITEKPVHKISGTLCPKEAKLTVLDISLSAVYISE